MFLAVIIPYVEEVTKVRFSIGSQTRDIRVSIRNVLLLFQAPLCSCQEFRSKQGRAGHVHQCETQASSLRHKPERAWISAQTHTFALGVDCESAPGLRTNLLSVTSDLQVCNQVRAPHQKHGSNAHNTMSSQLLHARELTVGTCQIRERSPVPAAQQKSRAASGSLHTHALPTHARSVTTRRSQYPAGGKYVSTPTTSASPSLASCTGLRFQSCSRCL